MKGFWGQIKHYDKDGKQIGYTVKGFWGERKRYDMDGNLVSYSFKNIWGGYNTYDADGNLISKTYKGIFGILFTYDKYGKKIGYSHENLYDGYIHYEAEDDDDFTYVCKCETYKTPVNHKESVKTYEPPKKSELQKKSELPKSYEPPKTYEQSKLYDTYETYVPFDESTINRNAAYYNSVEEYLAKDKMAGNHTKLLAFEYKGLKEFPAIAYVSGDVIKVVPLIHCESTIEFPVSELAEVRTVEVDALDMSDIDSEFASLGMSPLAREFETLYPDYQYGEAGMRRTQCEFANGLIVTGKSLEAMRKMLNTHILN